MRFLDWRLSRKSPFKIRQHFILHYDVHVCSTFEITKIEIRHYILKADSLIFCSPKFSTIHYLFFFCIDTD